MQIKRLAGELQLSRADVLDYLKWMGGLDPTVREQLKSTRLAAENAELERKEAVEERKQSKLAAEAAEKKRYQGALLAADRQPRCLMHVLQCAP